MRELKAECSIEKRKRDTAIIRYAVHLMSGRNDFYCKAEMDQIIHRRTVPSLLNIGKPSNG